MVDSELISEDIAILRETIRANDGENIATSVFARKVEQLISDFYDDIGALTALKLSDILDLFLIKVLYVDRRSLALDLYLIWLTAKAIFSRPAALADVAALLERLGADPQLTRVAGRREALVPYPPPGARDVVTRRG